MQRVEAPDDPYTIRRVVDNPLTDHGHVRAVVPLLLLTVLLSSACKAPSVVPARSNVALPLRRAS